LGRPDKGTWVALPSTLLMEDRDLRDKTLKLGLIARALGIYGVEKVFIFRDPAEDEVDDTSLIVEILRYIETPQYLRKKLYPIKPRLAYVGLLPPLRIPSHKPNLGMAGLKDGEIREAVVGEFRGDLVADVGVQAPLPFDGSAKAGSRVTVIIHRHGRDLSCSQVDRSQVSDYWGFEVSEQRKLEPLLVDGRVGLAVATSRRGTPVQDVWSAFSSAVKAAGKVLLVFGAPKRGLLEMYHEELLQRDCDFILNTIPDQKTETVRTEEALMATLAVVSIARRV
jgi:predicted SPOUT superfamily RNA methylase MTH1